MLDTVESIPLAMAMLVGIVLAGLYFGGLWWTVRRMPRARHPLTLYSGSLLFRLAIVLVAFYGVLTCLGWAPLVASLVGFFAVRVLLVHFLGHAPPAESSTQEAIE